MKLSCLPVSFFDDIIGGRMSVGEWAQMGADIGLDAIDVSILFFPDRSPEALAAIRRDIEAAGMQVTMMSTYPDFTHPAAEGRAREIIREQEAVAVAAALGVKLVRVTAGQAHPETGREEGIAWAVEGLKRLVETTRDTGVQLVYENHGKPGAWQYTDFSQPPDIFLEIARATADIGLGINFDTANATAFSEDPLALLDQVIDRVVSIHAADTPVRGELRPVIIGQGLAPFHDVFRRLHRVRWDGWICIEENAQQGREAVEEAVRFVRQAWAETAG